MRDNNLIPYNGAWIYATSDGWEANFRGFYYSSRSIDELKSKIDTVSRGIDINNILKMNDIQTEQYTVLNEEGDAEGIDWIVQFYLINLDDGYDDNIYENPIKELVINASDFETAVKYAQQYIRKQSIEDSAWKDASIISVTKR